MSAAWLTTKDVLSRHISWESYKTSGQLSDRDYALIKRLDKSTETARSSALEEVGKSVLRFHRRTASCLPETWQTNFILYRRSHGMHRRVSAVEVDALCLLPADADAVLHVPPVPSFANDAAFCC
jgi:hypothetical protein